MDKYEKLFVDTSKCFNGGKLPKPLRTLYQANEFKLCFNRLKKTGEASALTKEVAALFEKYGFKARPEGAGYIIKEA